MSSLLKLIDDDYIKFKPKNFVNLNLCIVLPFGTNGTFTKVRCIYFDSQEDKLLQNSLYVEKSGQYLNISKPLKRLAHRLSFSSNIVSFI